MRSLSQFLPRLWANWITLFGSVITSVTGLAIAFLLFADLVAPGKNPYASGIIMLVLPFIFIVGLLIIPVGLWIDRRRRAKGGAVDHGAIEKAFETALKDRSARNRILFVAVLTVVNVALLGFAGKSSIEYMDSPQFCGGACHSVMQPEWHAYQRSPHSNVACVECHIGTGATSYVKAKVNGIGQMWALFTNTYHRPVPAPVHNMHSSVTTCQNCHSRHYVGNKLKIIPHYKPDHDNTPAFNELVMHVGGPDATGKWSGIHWHASPDTEIRYQYLDEHRQKIGKITVLEKGKVTAEYLPPKAEGKVLGERTMDCIDCHNRPTHQFDASPKAAVDRAIYDGKLDAKIPELAQVAAELLVRPDGRRADAEKFFRDNLQESFRKRNVVLTPAELTQTATTLAQLYRLNVYPEMKLNWGTYRSNLGHEGDEGGCFRCHDKEHTAKAADGSEKTLSQDCDSCHERVALDEKPDKLDDTSQLLLPK